MSSRYTSRRLYIYMKLGINYLVFSGEELLEYTISSIRKSVDFVSVTYQTTSYYGDSANPLPTLLQLQESKLIDKIFHFEPNLSLHPKHNELESRNIGLKLSRDVGCSHHISADVDELYEPAQLEYVKEAIKDHDSSIAYCNIYYKSPTFLVYPDQNMPISFIHPVSNNYNKDVKTFPALIERTRQLVNHFNCRIFTKNEITIHHMSYVRKDIAKKLKNTSNSKFYKFTENFDKYRVGDRVCLPPDFMNRRTILVENKFGIKL